MKALVGILALAAAITSALADGSIEFQNGFRTRIYLYDYAGVLTNPVTSATLGSQTGGATTGVLDVGLVWGASANTVNTLAGIERIGTMPGELAGNGIFLVPGTNPGDTDYFQIYAWDSSYGDSLAGMDSCIASGGIFASATGTPGIYGSLGTPLAFTLGPATLGPGTVIFGSQPGFFNPFGLISPEPGVMVVGGFGAGVLLLWGRRKKRGWDRRTL